MVRERTSPAAGIFAASSCIYKKRNYMSTFCKASVWTSCPGIQPLLKFKKMLLRDTEYLLSDSPPRVLDGSIQMPWLGFAIVNWLINGVFNYVTVVL